jgi:stage II sporulation protein D
MRCATRHAERRAGRAATRVGTGALAFSRAVAAVALTGAVAWPAAADDLRVLLLESGRPVQVAGVRVAPAGAGLRVGNRTTGARWEAPGPGPHRAEAHRVRGALAVERSPGGLRVINRVPLEAYVAGTLGREIYPSWERETLRAQAVVTRTYALYQRARRRAEAWDLQADTSHQVYGGVAAETPAIVAAVADTRGEILTYRGAPILAAFHSASGGRTASAREVWGESLGYLRSVEVAGEEISPDTYWRARIPAPTMRRAVASLGLRLGALREVRVAERTASGRAARVELVDDGGARRSLSGRALRDALGASRIRSTLFQIQRNGNDFVFVGSGHGHGVGMSQWGAQAMARRGASYREILAAFYPGTRVERVGGTRVERVGPGARDVAAPRRDAR